MEPDDDPELAKLKAELARLRAANDRRVTETRSAIDWLEQAINEAEQDETAVKPSSSSSAGQSET